MQEIQGMEVYVLNESGYNEAVHGLSLSYGVPFGQAKIVANKLSNRDYGENKFLEQIEIWLDVIAPRYWWQEADTYRLSSKQSGSTMHTIHKVGAFKQEDFENWDTDPLEEVSLQILNEYASKYEAVRTVENLVKLKKRLPEGFLQRRVWKMSYKTLRNIVIQRSSHRLPHWNAVFVPTVLKQVKHPRLLPTL